MIKQLLLFGFVCWGIVYGFNRLTDGFSLSQMRSQIPVRLACSSPELSYAQIENLKEIFNQPFRYLGKGCQFYAFGSADGRYVLKFLKQKHLRQIVPFQKRTNECREERVKRLFSSVQLAYHEMPLESGLLYIHLNREPVLEVNVTLIDKLGIHHKVALDDYECILQERGLPVKELFMQPLTNEEVWARVGQLEALVRARCGKGIRDRDRSFAQNVVFAQDEDRAFFADVGQFYKDATILDSDEQARDLALRLANLRHFVKEKCGRAIDEQRCD